jgi:MYXO-CTERM domain-containing protein
MRRVTISSLMVLCGASMAFGQNVLTNPGFEDGLNGWFAFGNAYPESNNPPQFEAYEGQGLASMFGNWSGGFNVTGIFQEFATTEGDEWTMDAYSRHWSGDAMIGSGAPDSNWVVMKLAFFDAGNGEIGAAEGTILDGTFATDIWHDNAPIIGVAPAGTVKVQSFILYLQPLTDGGAAHIDNVSLSVVPAPGAMALLGLGGLVACRRRR